MLVDYERVVLELKKVIAGKSHHGQRDLLAEVARLEARYQLEEGLPERALRLYGVVITDDLTRPVPREGRVPAVEGHKDRALRGDSHNESKEDTHAGNSTRREGRSRSARARARHAPVGAAAA